MSVRARRADPTRGRAAPARAVSRDADLSARCGRDDANVPVGRASHAFDATDRGGYWRGLSSCIGWVLIGISSTFPMRCCAGTRGAWHRDSRSPERASSSLRAHSRSHASCATAGHDRSATADGPPCRRIVADRKHRDRDTGERLGEAGPGPRAGGRASGDDAECRGQRAASQAAPDCRRAAHTSAQEPRRADP